MHAVEYLIIRMSIHNTQAMLFETTRFMLVTGNNFTPTQPSAHPHTHTDQVGNGRMGAKPGFSFVLRQLAIVGDKCFENAYEHHGLEHGYG